MLGSNMAAGRDAAGFSALLRLARASAHRRPSPPAAALRGPSPAALQTLLERWRPRNRARARPAPSDEALRALFSSPPFRQRHSPRFALSMAGWLPGMVEDLSPGTVALIAQYVARHRLRQPPLLDAIATYLLRRATQLHPREVQKLVFPFSRTNYRPTNHLDLFPQLESVLLQKAATSPLATVNILMSLFQLCHFPLAVLHQVFSPSFLDSITGGHCGLIMRRYLSLLDVAVALEVQEYDGPRLDPRFRVCMFDGALTSDKARQKSSYKGLVAEALRQLVGEEGYQRDEVLPPGYCADFLLQISHSGSVLPRSSQAVALPEDVQTLPKEMLSGSLFRQQGLGSPPTRSRPQPGESPHAVAPWHCGGGLGEESCSSVLWSPHTGPLCSSTAQPTTCFIPPALGTEPQQHLPKGERPLPPPLAASPGAEPDRAYKAEEIHRVVLFVNDKWHYCQFSDVLVGSRAMRNRHLRLLGYNLVQLPYMELEWVRGVEEAKQYLCQKLRPLRGQVSLCGPLGGPRALWPAGSCSARGHGLFHGAAL